jgi:hypothetical protein
MFAHGTIQILLRQAVIMLLYNIITSFISFSTALAGVVVSILKVIILILAGIPGCIAAILIIFGLFLALQLPYLGSLAVIPYIYSVNLLSFFGLMKKDTSWCVAYDSVTKLPIDPAYITVRDMQGREVSSLITDLSGRFALLLPRGLYTIQASKTNYVFPSVKMIGTKDDGKYSNLYFGTVIEIDDTERSVAFSIPMDPIQEDWNQVEKKRKKLFYRFDDTRTYFHAARTYSFIALALSVIRYAVYPSQAMAQLLEISILTVLIVLAFTKHRSQYPHSFVIEKATGQPVSFAKVSIFSAKTGNKVASKTTSFHGQFTCLVSKGEYYLTVERRNAKGGYDLLYKSENFTVHDGYIGKRFDV